MVRRIYGNISGWVENNLLTFAFFFVPFVNFSPVACGVILLCAIISLWDNVRSGMNWSKLNVISLLVFAFMLYSTLASVLLHADFQSVSRLQFQIRLPLLLFSLAFLIRGYKGFPLRRALKFFALGSYGMALVVLMVFGYSLVMDFNDVPRSFMNISMCFQCVVNMIVHRTYMCFDLLTALLIFYFLFSDAWSRRRVYIFIGLIAFTGLFVFLTDARISLLSFMILLFSIVLKEVRRYVSGWHYIALLSVCLVGLFFVLSQSERVNNILLSWNDASYSLANADPRFRIWSCGLELFKKCPNPLWGYGCGAAKDLLQAEYARRNFVSAIDSHWEMHNQFLEILVENGVFGLFMFIGVLSLPMFLKSPLQRFYYIWLPILCVNLFFESMLSRAIGTYPIALILLLAGLSDGMGNFVPNVMWKRFCVISFLIAVLGVSVKYIHKDKRDAYAAFQRFFERVDILPGNPPQELNGVYGMRIDNHIESEVWRNNAVMYHCLDKKSVEAADSVSFSLYMYVSEDFDADVLQIRVEERTQKAYVASYDMNRKGEWQLLSVRESGLYGNVVFTISCAQKNVADFSSLNGYALFAYPRINVVRGK
jgi:Lipid A core - O-antigen ligase and related enzymes